eukprot:Phypoly_transcript_05140.p1 GENE.Phypoly_transcript_05140~~Phypoly_transcript_05140.p1  ORF type:complete len:476 (+),score=65.15 Phypoly_transcript_05140:65-1492(+)
MALIILLALFIPSVICFSPCLSLTSFHNRTFSPSSLLPLTHLTFNNSYVDFFANDGTSFYSFVKPTKLQNPILVNLNYGVAHFLGILLDSTNIDISEYLSGNKPIPGYDPIAMAYAGHQFGGFTPQLGDGRASLLGEIYTNGENWALHAKGTGPTPYSRGGDGRAVLRSSIREYLCGEALYHLGIPTTRALSIVGSETQVWRESLETAAVVIRVGPISGFVRFGTFELFARRKQHQHVEKLANYVIAHDFPHLAKIKKKELKFAKFLSEIARQTGELVAKWMAFGFSHGVLNTDNMSILSLTIDFGPFGFMDAYNSHFIPNHSDDEGRYAFDQQVAIGRWNLERLVEAFGGLMPIMDLTNKVAGIYEESYRSHYASLMRAKLGFSTSNPDDESLWHELLEIMQNGGADYTLLFRKLGNFRPQTNYTLLTACESTIQLCVFFFFNIACFIGLQKLILDEPHAKFGRIALLFFLSMK